MKIKNIAYTFVAGGLLTLTACSDFGDMNVDPNSPSVAPTSTLLTNAEASISGLIGATTPTLYVQHLSETQYTEDSRYGTVQFDFNGWYTGPLINLEEIIKVNSDEETRERASAYGSNNNQIAVARILKAYYFGAMTDRWGALPYTEALLGREDFSPAYDMQEDIYPALITELEEAAAQIDGGAGVDGDIIFGGNMGSWARFANTLRANMAMRMSDVSSAAQGIFEDAVADGLITSDVSFTHLANADYQNPWYARFITRTDYSLSEPLVDELVALNDPRLPAFATPALGTVTSKTLDYSNFVGMPYGVANAGDIPNQNVSFMSQDIIYTQDAPQYIFTVAQVNFMLAEAAVKGWAAGGTAAQFYADGIEASFAQWGVLDIGTYVYPNMNSIAPANEATVDVIDYADYMLQPEVVFNPATAMEQIATQKWIALYLQGYEAWAEWRRLDAPALAPAPDATNNSGLIPVRHGYPSSENDLNGANYDAIVAAQGADNLDTKLWWDAN